MILIQRPYKSKNLGNRAVKAAWANACLCLVVLLSACDPNTYSAKETAAFLAQARREPLANGRIAVIGCNQLGRSTIGDPRDNSNTRRPLTQQEAISRSGAGIGGSVGFAIATFDITGTLDFALNRYGSSTLSGNNNIGGYVTNTVIPAQGSQIGDMAMTVDPGGLGYLLLATLPNENQVVAFNIDPRSSTSTPITISGDYNRPKAITVRGNYAFVANEGDNSLAVIDLRQLNYFSDQLSRGFGARLPGPKGLSGSQSTVRITDIVYDPYGIDRYENRPQYKDKPGGLLYVASSNGGVYVANVSILTRARHPHGRGHYQLNRNEKLRGWIDKTQLSTNANLVAVDTEGVVAYNSLHTGPRLFVDGADVPVSQRLFNNAYYARDNLVGRQIVDLEFAANNNVLLTLTNNSLHSYDVSDISTLGLTLGDPRQFASSGLTDLSVDPDGEAILVSDPKKNLVHILRPENFAAPSSAGPSLGVIQTAPSCVEPTVTAIMPRTRAQRVDDPRALRDDMIAEADDQADDLDLGGDDVDVSEDSGEETSDIAAP